MKKTILCTLILLGSLTITAQNNTEGKSLTEYYDGFSNFKIGGKWERLGFRLTIDHKEKEVHLSGNNYYTYNIIRIEDIDTNRDAYHLVLYSGPNGASEKTTLIYDNKKHEAELFSEDERGSIQFKLVDSSWK